MSGPGDSGRGSGTGTDPETQAELNAVRETFHEELARKAARIAQLEQLVDEVHRSYRSTLSWRVTAPLRAARRISRALRRA
jgi:hypothetical protein